MMVLYAVTATGPRTSAVTAGTGLRAHESRDLTVLVEPRSDPPERTSRELLAFARVLQQLSSRTTLLPVRFGTTVADEAELAELVAEHRTEWTRRLAAVAGHSECIVHVHVPPARAAAAARAPTRAEGDRESGREYLRRRAHEVAQQDSTTAELRALLAPYAAETTVLPGIRADEIRLSFLVPDEMVDVARSTVLGWAKDRSEVSFTGPWPPFSFCREVSA